MGSPIKPREYEKLTRIVRVEIPPSQVEHILRCWAAHTGDKATYPGEKVFSEIKVMLQPGGAAVVEYEEKANG